ncbi:Peptidase family M1 [Planctomycetes bacterium Pla163]|uniref:Peptidase family M1 n=1 Tax=Rohdeia mirabilis TaxID=2528008 RepID=A0A518D4P9_9BACT|nr:Peptidase family M1 [Planctomycetes bacterium Pla163]
MSTDHHPPRPAPEPLRIAPPTASRTALVALGAGFLCLFGPLVAGARAQEPAEPGPTPAPAREEVAQDEVAEPIEAPQEVQSGPAERPRRPRFRPSTRATDRGPVTEPLGPKTPGGVLDRGGRSRTDYAIDARLERTAAGSNDTFAGDLDFFDLDGRLTLTWTNGSDDAVSDLWFHVYLNAFANNRTTHLEAARGVLRGTRVTEGWGFTEIEGVRLRTGDEAAGAPALGADLMPTLTWEQPDDGNEYDRTVFRVELAEAVAPGATVAIDVEWNSRLPRVRRRTGTKDDFMLMAQWFPKLGVYESGRGWNCHQFHAWSEWYADYGTYDVSLDLPAEYWVDDGAMVFGSGLRVNQMRRGDRTLVTFQAPSPEDREREDASGKKPLVHDFMWTADPDFVVESATFKFSDWQKRYPAEVERVRAALGPEADLELRDVTIDVLIQPERRAQAQRHIDATAATLFFYGLWFGEYPFERITVVDPAWGAREAGGMEYPTIFTAGTRLFTEKEMHSPESVTIHEAGHQWFYLLVGNNEFEAAWMDEGLNSFADSEVLDIVYGDRWATTDYSRIPSFGRQLIPFGNGVSGKSFSLRRINLPNLSFLGIDTDLYLQPNVDGGFVDWWRDQPIFTNAPERSDARWSDRARYLGTPDVDPIDNWPWLSAFRDSHYNNTYARTASVLRSMPALIAAASPGVDGEEAFIRGMRHYASVWRYAHPYPDDFFRAFAEGDGVDVDLAPYFQDLFRDTLTVDWSIEVEQRRESDADGAFMGEDGQFRSYADDLAMGRTDEAPVAEDVADEEVPEAATEAATEDVVADAATDGGPPAEEARVVATGSEVDRTAEPYQVEILLRRRGDLALPVPVRVTFEDGTTRDEVWTRAEQLEQRWKRLRFESVSRVVSAEIDPDRGYYLDLDMSDNQWHAETDGRVQLRWTERVFNQLARQFQWQKGIGG